jgi:hypothetical protein
MKSISKPALNWCINSKKEGGLLPLHKNNYLFFLFFFVAFFFVTFFFLLVAFFFLVAFLFVFFFAGILTSFCEIIIIIEILSRANLMCSMDFYS